MLFFIGFNKVPKVEECLIGYSLLMLLSCGGEYISVTHRFIFAGNGYKYQSYGFFFTTSGWPGDARGRYCVVGIHPRSAPLCHLYCRGFRYGSFLL